MARLSSAKAATAVRIRSMPPKTFNLIVEGFLFNAKPKGVWMICVFLNMKMKSIKVLQPAGWVFPKDAFVQVFAPIRLPFLSEKFLEKVKRHQKQ